MAEEKKSEKQQHDKKQQLAKHDRKEEKEEKKLAKKPELYEAVVRIMGYDIPTSKNIYAGLTRIKGISWNISNAICRKMGYQRTKKIAELSKEDIKKLETFLENLPIYDFLKNRRFDRETGQTSHIYSSDLDMVRSFDIKRLKQIKSYRGLRHSMGLPTRGQKTRSHFRTKGRKAVGVTKGKAQGKKQ